MHLYWQRHLYTYDWYVFGEPPFSYSVYVAEGARDPISKRPKRRIVTYLGSVNLRRQERGSARDYAERWPACRWRCQFWERAEAKLSAAVAAGKMTQEQRETMREELAQAVPPPSADHRHEKDGHIWYVYHPGRSKESGCEPEPVRLPEHVQAATDRYWNRAPRQS